MKKFGAITGFGLGFLPMLAFAQQQDIPGVLTIISRILNTVIPILITLGVIFFIWGVIQYVTAKDEEKQKEARQTMIYGIIGLFVIVSIWGLVGLLTKTFGINPAGGGPGFPCVKGTPGCP